MTAVMAKSVELDLPAERIEKALSTLSGQMLCDDVEALYASIYRGLDRARGSDDGRCTYEEQVEAGTVFAELNGRIRELEDNLKVMTEDRDEFAAKVRRSEHFEQHTESELEQLFVVVSSSDMHGRDSTLSQLPSFEEAKREAEGVAEILPEERHYVMMAVGSAKAGGVQWTKSDVYFTDDKNEIPS